MKGKTILIAVLVVFVVAFSSVVYCEEKKAEAQKAGASPPPPDIEVAEVIQKEVPMYREYVATTDGYTNATILAQVQGYLIRQEYQEGAFVKKGSLLFEIDPRPFQASLDVAKAVLAQHQAVYQTAKATLDRILPLAEAKAVSQKDKDDAIGRVQAAEAQVLAARAEVRKAELDLGFTRITSPIDGIAGAAKAQIGDLVGPPQAQVLTTVSTVNPIKVYVSLSEREYLQAMERRAKTKGEGMVTELDLVLTDGTTWPQKGSLAFADRQVDPQTGTIRIATLFPNPDNILRPGQYAKVKALMKKEGDTLMVPQRAVGELQGMYQVAVVDADNTVRIRNVKVGERSGEFWVIKEGLKPGDKVVVEGIQKVRDGIKVNPKPYSTQSN
ncbi:Efflux transporter, RND family, MFP subunit [uncultured Desulfobacterium sp.]|uniref:Efflux transporter, RND family, MFP subunit n=1 Tax=uncultured Desulfobacterium sp. TaxID=201089 RepID=A0A445N1L2_9BACT|nr:Efflux transporter, RND family, MFP subunit [uncultured Desulfobacterium sp.]